MTFMKTTRRRRRGAATRAADSVEDDETNRPWRVWTNGGPGDHDLDAERNTDGTRRNRTGSMDKTMKDGVVLHKIAMHHERTVPGKTGQNDGWGRHDDTLQRIYVTSDGWSTSQPATRRETNTI